MKKLISLFVLALTAGALYSQATISFCTYVDMQGYCAFNNNKFITTPDSTNGRIFIKINSNEPLGSKLVYKIFSVDKAGEEKQTNSFEQAINADWYSAWQPYVFATNASYKVQVFNDADKMISSKTFELIAGK